MNSPSLLAAGAPISDYTIEGVLGRGGMAVVYRATHPALDEPVALKLVAPGSRWDDEAAARFEREARLAAAVAHRAILPVYEIGWYESRPFVAMKLERGDLGRVLREERRLTPARAVALVSQIASALDAAHAHGLVHRDVKPSNVLLGEEEGEERAYVADFGIARAAFSEGEDFPAGELVGTVGYASPEQIRGEPFDRRTDVYALGCLLHECLTGRLPFAGRDSLAILWGHLHAEPLEPSMLAPSLLSAVGEVLRRALAKQPEARFSSAGELAEEASVAVHGRSPRRKPAAPGPSGLPSGTVTLLAAEGLQEEDRRVLEAACSAAGGVMDEHAGFLAAFSDAAGALRAASSPSPARVAVHTGRPHLTSSGYVGADLERAMGIAAAAHAGQVVLSASTAAMVGARQLRPLGLHRVEGFPEPVVLYQLGEATFPPLKTVANTNLPAQLSSFLGRERELRQADRLLRETRLLCVTGPGGAGKTRFALELAGRTREQRFHDYSDGVFACFLAPLRDPTLVLVTVAQALSVAERPATSAVEAIAAHIGHRRILLLLDNFEHVLSAAPELAELLQHCPGLTLLATSREPVHLPDERAYELPPLAVDESVALFCERAACEPSETIVELCSRLEGLPLAIELAAVRMSVLSPEQLLARLSRRLDVLKAGRDADPRQQTLRATIEWSYDLLAPEAQRPFTRLSVFAGGCTLEAAEAVCGADLDSIQALLDKSLLRRTGERFWMLETIREYAAELLEESGEAHESRRRHARHYADLAERLEPDLRTSRHVETIDRLEADHANYVQAIEWALETDTEFALALFGKLRHVWWDRGREGWMLAQRVLAAAPTRPTPARASALHAASGLAWTYGDLEQAVSLEEQALAIYEDSGDGHRSATASVFLGLLYQAIGRDGAREKLEQGLAGLQAAGDEYGVANAIGNLSDFALQDGAFAAAARLAEQSATLGRDHGFELIEAMASCNQAVALVHLADPRAAETACSALRLCAQTKMHLWIGNTLFIVAAAIAADEPRRAAVLLGAADAELQGGRLAPAEKAVYEQARTTARDALGGTLFEQSLEKGRLLGRDAAVQLGLGSIEEADVGHAPTPAASATASK